MNLYGFLSLAALQILGGLLLWWSLRSRSRALRLACADRLNELEKTLAASLLSVHKTLLEENNRLYRILNHIEKDRETQARLWLGAFLPSDETAAEMEREIRATEDRSISATRPPWSSRPASELSASPSSRRGSTPPARNSGGR